MQIPLLDLRIQYEQMKDEINEALARVLRDCRFVMGPDVRELEEEIAAYCGAKFAVGVNSGTDALLLSLEACGIKEGDEVITTPFTFVGTVEAIFRTGARPVFADVDPRTYNLKAEEIEKKISARTRALLPVHLYGQPAEMDSLLALAGKRKLKIIEDCAQAVGAEYGGKKVGSIGDAGAFSFFPSKNLGACGDGGMVVTGDEKIAGRIKMLRNHGSRQRYNYQICGYNSRLDTLQAAVLRVKLKYLDGWNEARRQKAYLYNHLFKQKDLAASTGTESAPLEERVILPFESRGIRHVYNLYTIRAGNRDRIKELLGKSGIAAEIYYPSPLHLQEVCGGLGYREGDFPVSERIAREVLSLPLYPELPDKEIERIVDSVERFLIQTVS